MILRIISLLLLSSSIFISAMEIEESAQQLSLLNLPHGARCVFYKWVVNFKRIDRTQGTDQKYLKDPSLLTLVNLARTCRQVRTEIVEFTSIRKSQNKLPNLPYLIQEISDDKKQELITEFNQVAYDVVDGQYRLKISPNSLLIQFIQLMQDETLIRKKSQSLPHMFITPRYPSHLRKRVTLTSLPTPTPLVNCHDLPT